MYFFSMKYFSVTPATPYSSHPRDFTINDIVTTGTFLIAVGSGCLSIFLWKSRSQAQELDRASLEQSSNQIKKTEENLEKMLNKLATSMEKLNDLTSELTTKIAVLETKQNAFSISQTQIESIRIKQEETDRRINLIEQSIRLKS